jgi:hypothetical protein
LTLSAFEFLLLLVYYGLVAKSHCGPAKAEKKGYHGKKIINDDQ